MKYSLPTWLQVMAIACLSSALAYMVGWSWKNEHWIARANLDWWAHNVIYLCMALPVVLLAARFLWCYRETRHSEQAFERLVYWLGLLCALPAFVFLLRWFLPPIQKVREAGQWWA